MWTIHNLLRARSVTGRRRPDFSALSASTGRTEKELGNDLTTDFVTDNDLLSDEDSMNCDRLFEREALPKLSGGFGTVAFVRTGDAHRDLQDVEMLGRAE